MAIKAKINPVNLMLDNYLQDSKGQICRVEKLHVEMDECGIYAIDSATTHLPVEGIPLSEELIICGGITNGNQYLDSIQYGTKMHNPFNNYVNPFYLFDIMNDEGKRFFLDYFKEDFKYIIATQKSRVSQLKNKISIEKDALKYYQSAFASLIPTTRNN